MKIPPAVRYAATPVLAAAFPVVSLYSRNMQHPLAEVGPCVAWAALGGLVFYVLLFGLYRDATKATVLALPAIALFFLYGVVTTAFSASGGGEATEMRSLARGGVEIVYALLWGGVGVLVLAGKRWRPFDTFARVVTVAVLGTIAIPLLQLTTSAARQLSAPPLPPLRSATAVPSAVADGPDIYYVVLDCYARDDVLRVLYGADNAPFLDALRARGFFVAGQSRANYLMTYQSLASSLNLDYLDDVLYTDATTAMRNCYRLVQDNEASRFLKGCGYSIVNVSSGYWLTSPIACADVELRDAAVDVGVFRTTVVKMTPLATWRGDLAAPHRARIMFGLDRLREIPAMQGRKFVFGHIVCPHPPFVFDSKGGPLSLGAQATILDAEQSILSHDEYAYGYREQVHFLNARLLEMIDDIRAQYPPERQPVIILQGDHGGGMLYNTRSKEQSYLPERAPIFMAMLLPADRRFETSAGMTPVNLFRVVFNGLFDTRLPLLPDKTYYVPINRPKASSELPVEALDPVTVPPPWRPRPPAG